jgi:eukaryotic-like serine/threonine-protein kinase
LGERFGKYELERRLAFGGMAEIFVAALHGEKGFAKRVVLKRILPQFGADPSFVSMFIDEAVLAARLTHPNVVQVYDFGEVDGVFYIAMELVDGADLRRLLRSAAEKHRALSAAEVAAIGEGLCRALSYAHAAAADDGRPLGLVHRDVSPHNVMLSRSGEAKLMDFGIAKAEARATRTATGTIKGKVAYMAPEQAGGKEIDKRADQFALGLVLWECLTGVRLFQGDSDLELLRIVLACDTRPPSTLRPDVPEALERVIMRALSPDADGRYPDLAEMERELSAFRFSLGTAGAVQLGALVDELAPREPVAAPRGTLPLPAARAGWTDLVEAAAPTRVDRPAPVEEPVPAPPKTRRTPWLVAGGAVVLALGVGLAALRVAWRPTPVATALVVVESTPPGAAVSLDGLDTGLVTPARLPGLPRGKTSIVGVALAGYGIQQRVVTPAGERELVQVALVADVPAPVPPPVAVASPVAAPEPQPRRAIIAKPRPPPKPPGALSLRSSGPWFDVYLGSEKIGTTPLVRRELPAGTHRLRLVNPTLGVEKKLEVTIAPGEELQRTVGP